MNKQEFQACDFESSSMVSCGGCWAMYRLNGIDLQSKGCKRMAHYRYRPEGYIQEGLMHWVCTTPASLEADCGNIEGWMKQNQS